MFEKSTRNIAALVCLSLAGATLPSCTKISTEASLSTVKLPEQPWNGLGQGVYTFQFDSTWPASLVEFRKRNPDLEITAMYTDRETGSHGCTHSVVIVTEPK